MNSKKVRLIAQKIWNRYNINFDQIAMISISNAQLHPFNEKIANIEIHSTILKLLSQHNNLLSHYVKIFLEDVINEVVFFDRPLTDIIIDTINKSEKYNTNVLRMYKGKIIQDIPDEDVTAVRKCLGRIFKKWLKNNSYSEFIRLKERFHLTL